MYKRQFLDRVVNGVRTTLVADAEYQGVKMNQVVLLNLYFTVQLFSIDERSIGAPQFPEDQRAQLPPEFQEDGRFESGETECTIDGDTETGRLQVVRWDNISDTGNGTTFIAGFNDIRLDKDAMAVVIAFVPDGTDVGKPPWVEDFEEDSLNDSGQLGSDQLFPGVEVDSEGDVNIDTDSILDEAPADETES